MSRLTLIRSARQLLTLRGNAAPRRGAQLGELGLIPDGAVLVRDGRIVCVGPTRRLENLAEARQAEVIEADGCVVMPGFVDPHTHLISGPARVAEFEMRLHPDPVDESLLQHQGLEAQVRNVRGTPARRLELQARQILLQCLRHGTTTLEAKTGYGLDDTGEMKSVRILEELQSTPVSIVPTWFGARALPPEHAEDPAGYLNFLVDEMLPRVSRRRTIPYMDADPGACGFSLQQSIRLLRMARFSGLTPRLHACFQRADAQVELAVAFESIAVSHCNYITPTQIAHLTHSGTVAVLIPGAVYHLRLAQQAPARAMIERGVAVALASGFDPLSSPTCSMQMVVSLACNQMKMSPAEAIQAATFNAACAAGVGMETGSLEPGKLADILLLAVPDYREIPYHFGMNLVTKVLRRGVTVHQELAPEWQVA